MASEGPLIAGSGVDNVGVGTIVWSNPGNITVDDNTRATASWAAPGNISHYLQSGSHGFNIPAGSTIDGIVVRVQKRQSNDTSDTFDNSIRLIHNGTVVGNNKADAVEWTTTETNFDYGSSSDTWASGLTAANINETSFGAVVSAYSTSGANSCTVDAIWITVYYTPAIAGYPPVHPMATMPHLRT